MSGRSLSGRIGILLAIALASAVSARSWAATVYTITDLGVGAAYGVNESGQVAGLSGTSSFQAFSYLNGVKTVFGGVAFGHSFSRAWGINESGLVSGSYYNDASGNNSNAFRWQNGSGSTIPLDNGYGINDQGTIVGDRLNGSIVNAAISSNGTVTDLGSLGGRGGRAWDINNAGQVVGVDYDAARIGHAFVWNGGAMSSLSTRESEAQDINNAGQIVGYNKLANGRKHATLWQSGQTIDLDTLNTIDSIAYGINDSGTVVGYAGFAFIHQNGQMQLLNDLIDPNSGWTLVNALDISNRGQIVGSGTFNGATHAFLLTPLPAPPAVWGGLALLAGIALQQARAWIANRAARNAR